VPSPFRDEVTLAKDEAIDVLVTLEAARGQLEGLVVWTTLLVDLIEREMLLSGRLLK
jgi:hypothetical protein